MAERSVKMIQAWSIIIIIFSMSLCRGTWLQDPEQAAWKMSAGAGRNFREKSISRWLQPTFGLTGMALAPREPCSQKSPHQGVSDGTRRAVRRCPHAALPPSGWKWGDWCRSGSGGCGQWGKWPSMVLFQERSPHFNREGSAPECYTRIHFGLPFQGT